MRNANVLERGETSLLQGDTGGRLEPRRPSEPDQDLGVRGIRIGQGNNINYYYYYSIGY